MNAVYRIIDITQPGRESEIASFDSAYAALDQMRRAVLSANDNLQTCAGWRLVDPANSVLVEPQDLLDAM